MDRKPPQSRTQKRRAEIEDAAFQLLLEKGYKATSVLAVARRARASNETLYRWYGNKQALFLALVERNAAEAGALLEQALAKPTSLPVLLDQLGPLLLKLVLGERAVALNRAAAADVHDTATLGKVIAAGGRDRVEEKLAAVIAKTGKAPAALPPQQAASAYLDLLIGDLQRRRIIGADPPPDPADITRRATRARDLLLKLLEPEARLR